MIETTEIIRLRERDTELFELVNTLKGRGMVYQNTDPQLYGRLVDRRDEIDQELGPDDCYLRIVRDKGLAVLSFYPDDDDYKNALRKKFTPTEMKFYTVLLYLYMGGYISSGDYVPAGTEDFIAAWEKLGFTTKASSASKSYLLPHIKTMKKYGILAESGNEQYIIQPGVMFGLDMHALMELHSSILLPWLSSVAGDVSAWTDTGDTGKGKEEETAE